MNCESLNIHKDYGKDSRTQTYTALFSTLTLSSFFPFQKTAVTYGTVHRIAVTAVFLFEIMSH